MHFIKLISAHVLSNIWNDVTIKSHSSTVNHITGVYITTGTLQLVSAQTDERQKKLAYNNCSAD